MKYTFLTFIFSLSMILANAQEQEYPVDTSEISQFNIKTSALTPFDPLISSAQIALEFRLKQHWAIEGSYFVKTPAILNYTNGKYNQKLLMYKAEFRRFFQDELYTAFEYGHIDYQYDLDDDFITIEDFDQQGTREIKLFNYESAHFRKTVNMFNMKFGIEYNSRKVPRLVFDYFIGVGVRKVAVDYTDVFNPVVVYAFPQVTQGKEKRDTYAVPQANGTYIIDGIDQNNPPSDAVNLGRNAQGTRNPDGTYNHAIIDTPAWDLAEGTTWRGNFTFGVKIGYTLWSKQKHLYRH